MIMRDERCAETIHRLLNDLDGLLVSRHVGDTGSFLAGNLDEKVWREEEMNAICLRICSTSRAWTSTPFLRDRCC